MKKAVKKMQKRIKAYPLGSHTSVEKDLIEKGKIRITEEGKYELFSREAVHGQGELAQQGDYVQVDSAGYPYPCSRGFFERRHKKIAECEYVCLPVPVDIWRKGDPICDEIIYLLTHKDLTLNPNDKENYFTAPLWGSRLSAAMDAVLVCYEVKRDADGNICDIDFNFVEKNEFDQMYDELE